MPPSRELKVSITGDTRGLSRALTSVGRDLDRSEHRFSSFAKHSALAFGAVGAAAGVTLVEGLKKSVEAWSESEKVQAQTAAVMKSTGGQAKVTAKQITELATAVSRKTGIDDEAVQSAENLLLTFTKVRNETGKGNDVFTQATKIATDMSVALGTDLNKSAIQLGKALNDPIKGITGLQRVGVSFTQSQRDQIKALVDSGHKLEAQKLILHELRTEFGGSADAAGNTFSGAINKAKVEVQNLEEAIGKQLTPVLKQGTSEFTKFVIQIEDHKGAGGRFAAAVEGGIKTASSAVSGFVKNMTGRFHELRAQGKSVGDSIRVLVAEGFGKIADFAGKQLANAAPHVASAFATAFLNTGVWGKFLAGAWLLKKFGGLKAFATLGMKTGAEYATGFQTGSARGGAAGGGGGAIVAGGGAATGGGRILSRLPAGLRGGAAVAGNFARNSVIAGTTIIMLDSATRPRTGSAGGVNVQGYRSGTSGAVERVADTLGSPLNFLTGSKGIGDARVKATTDEINKWAKVADHLAAVGSGKGLRDLAFSLKAGADVRFDNKALASFGDVVDHMADRVRTLRQAASAGLKLPVDADVTQRGLQDITDAFAGMRGNAYKSLTDVKTDVKLNMRLIARNTRDGSDDAKAALAGNFRNAADAVQRQMDRAGHETKAGVALINKYMRAALGEYGITGKQASNYLNGRDTGTGKSLTPATTSGGYTVGGGMAVGGWIGAPGEAGQDTVPVMLGRGEAVLNRHQQAPVEAALQMTYGVTLDDLFGSVQRPHYMARGGRPGIVAVPGFPGELAASSIIPKIGSIAHKFPGLVLTDAFDPTGRKHKSPGHEVTGTAADFAGPDKLMDAAVRYLVAQGYLVGYDGRFGSAAWPGHGPSYVAGGNAHFHVELGGAGGALSGATVASLKRAKFPAGMGLLSAIGQKGLDRVRGAAQSVLNTAVGSSLSAPMGGGIGTGGAGSNVIAAFHRAIRTSGATPIEQLALWEAGIVESGLQNLTHGDRDSLGALQERTSIYGRAHALNPFASALRFLRQAAGLRPWRGSAGSLAQAVQRSAFPGRYDGAAVQAQGYMARGGRVGMARGGRTGTGRPVYLRPTRRSSGTGLPVYLRPTRQHPKLVGQHRQLTSGPGVRHLRPGERPPAWGSPLEWYNLMLGEAQQHVAQAALTDDPADDIAAAHEVLDWAGKAYHAALQTHDTQTITDAAGVYADAKKTYGDLTAPADSSSTTGDTSGTGEDPMVQAVQDQIAAEQALQASIDAHKASIDALNKSISDQNKFNTSLVGTQIAQISRALADMMSGEIVGKGLVPRSALPNSGVIAAY